MSFRLFPMVILVSCQHKYCYKIFPLLSFISAQFQNFVAFYSQYLQRARVGAVESYETEIVLSYLITCWVFQWPFLHVNNARLHCRRGCLLAPFSWGMAAATVRQNVGTHYQYPKTRPSFYLSPFRHPRDHIDKHDNPHIWPPGREQGQRWAAFIVRLLCSSSVSGSEDGRVTPPPRPPAADTPRRYPAQDRRAPSRQTPWTTPRPPATPLTCQTGPSETAKSTPFYLPRVTNEFSISSAAAAASNAFWRHVLNKLPVLEPRH